MSASFSGQPQNLSIYTLDKTVTYHFFPILNTIKIYVMIITASLTKQADTIFLPHEYLFIFLSFPKSQRLGLYILL